MTRGKWIILGMLILLGGTSILFVKQKRAATSRLLISEAQETSSSLSEKETESGVEGHERLDAVAAEDQPIARSTRQLRVIVQTEEQLGLAGAEVRARFKQLKGKPSLNQFNRTFTTDSDGVATVPLPGEEFITGLELFASQNDYAARKMVWDIATGDRIPVSYTFTLTNGLFIGGIVVDAKGSPIKGANVRVLHWQPVQSFPKGESAGFLMQTQTTDEKGHWTARNVPAELVHGMTIEARHPDFLTVQFQVSDPKVESQLRAGQHEWVLDRLQHVYGTVFNEAGGPISEAKVWLGRPSSRERQSTRSDEQGRFAFRDATAGKIPITAMARGYAPASEVIEITDGEGEEIILRLAEGSFVRGTVVGPDGKPLKGVRVNLEDLPSHESRHNFEFTQITEEDGKFEWDSAPNAPMTFYFGKPGYQDQSKVVLKPNEEHVVTLSRALLVEGQILDAETGKPVKEFEIGLGKMENNHPYFPRKLPEKCISEDGRFSMELDESDNAIHAVAEGYSEKCQFLTASKAGTVQVTINLKPSDTLTGVLLSPDGSPAAGVDVGLIDDQFPHRFMMQFYKGHVTTHAPKRAVARSDQDGRFVFHSLPEADAATVIAATKSAFASVSLSELRASGILMLERFGRVEGVYISNSRPIEGQEFVVRSTNPMINFDLEVCRGKTDAAGRFTIENIPPGNVSILRIITFYKAPVFSHPVEIIVKSGETTKVQLGASDAILHGIVRFEGETPKVDFLIVGLLSSMAPEIQHDNERKNYFVSIPSDGTFILDSIPPGEYNLEIRAAEVRRDSGPTKTLGFAKTTVVVPPGSTPATPIDIGEIVLMPPEQ